MCLHLRRVFRSPFQGAPKSSTPAAAVVSLPLPAAPHGALDDTGHTSPRRYVADTAFDAAMHAQDDVCNALLSDLLPALLKGGAGAASMLMCVKLEGWFSAHQLYGSCLPCRAF